uniref:addiction module antidote protein n=1 Tax=Halomonas sp. TaxID=1486246 RepID=UPI0026318CC8|nr:addiction module antidote protein [Halomonas sp.]
MKDVNVELSVAVASGDAGQIMKVLSNLARDELGMTKLANATGLARGNLYRILREDGNPTLSTLLLILDALDLKLSITAKPTEEGACHSR